nr:hypothetical protein [Tanacetum cinerariifolium]
IAPSSPSQPTETTKTIATSTPTAYPPLRQYFRKAKRIAQSIALSTTADEPASLSRVDSQGEAFLIVIGLEVGQDRENITKTSALPHNSPPRVTSLVADEGIMQHQLQELIDLCTRLQRQSLETEEEAGVDKSTERGSNDTEELVNVLTSMDAAIF